MNNQIIVGMDVDGVCGNLIYPWLRRYNKDWNDFLSPEYITDWNIHQFVKPECGEKMYEYIQDPSLYDEVMPIDGALWGTKKIKEMGYRIVYITHSTLGHAGRKFRWLKDFGFIENEEDYIECKDKSLLRASYLVDDYYGNIQAFKEVGIIFTQPYNKVILHTPRCDNWRDIVRYFEKELLK